MQLEENECHMMNAAVDIAELNVGELEWILLDSGSAAHGCPLEYVTEYPTGAQEGPPLHTATGE